MASLNPLQVLLLGLAGYGGYKQGKQQRADYMGEQQAKAAQLAQEAKWKERALAIDEMLAGPQARLYNANAGKAEADASAAGAATGAWGAVAHGLLGAIAPGGTQQDMTQRIVEWVKANPGVPLPPEFVQTAFEAAFKAPQTTGANFQVNPFTGQTSNYGPTNSDQAALMREARLGGMGKSPEQLFDPTDVAKVYMPAAIASYKKLYPEGTENAPDFKQYWKEYMAEMSMFAGVQTSNPNMPPADQPPPGTQWQWIDELGDWAPVPVGPAIGNFSDQPPSPLLSR